MYCKLVTLCALVAAAQAGLLAPAVHYSSTSAVSSQSIARYGQPHGIAKVAVASPVTYHASPIAYHASPAVIAHHAAPAFTHVEPFDAHPKYEYNYSVADRHTGDIKSQQESRDGDVVKGVYSFHEADGSVRTVEYAADDHSGFNAVVHNTAPTAAPVHLKAVPVHVAPAYYHH